MLYRKRNRRKQKEKQLGSVFIIRKRQKWKTIAKLFPLHPKAKRNITAVSKLFALQRNAKPKIAIVWFLALPVSARVHGILPYFQ